MCSLRFSMVFDYTECGLIVAAVSLCTQQFIYDWQGEIPDTHTEPRHYFPTCLAAGDDSSITALHWHAPKQEETGGEADLHRGHSTKRSTHFISFRVPSLHTKTAHAHSYSANVSLFICFFVHLFIKLHINDIKYEYKMQVLQVVYLKNTLLLCPSKNM